MAAAYFTPGLIDTDILIDGTRRLPDAISFLASQQIAGRLNIGIVSAMELIQGCRNKTELSQIKELLNRINVIPVSSAMSQTACQLMETFFLGQGLVIPDALIAATAIEQGLTLYSKNIRHYRMIANLSVIRPY